MAKQGRKPKGWKPVITPENEAAAREFLDWIGKFYEEGFSTYAGIFGMDMDAYNDAILRIHTSLLNNGISQPQQDRDRMWRNILFMSLRRNSTEKWNRREIPTDETDFCQVDEETCEEKTERHLWDDYRTYYVLRYVEDNYDPVTFNCFRIYYIVPGMTYARLKSLTGVTDCKRRVVECRREVSSAIDMNAVRQEFEEWLEDRSKPINVFIV